MWEDQPEIREDAAAALVLEANRPLPDRVRGVANTKDGLGQFDVVDASDLATFGWERLMNEGRNRQAEG